MNLWKSQKIQTNRKCVFFTTSLGQQERTPCTIFLRKHPLDVSLVQTWSRNATVSSLVNVTSESIDDGSHNMVQKKEIINTAGSEHCPLVGFDIPLGQ